jgi:hypothetical protein
MTACTSVEPTDGAVSISVSIDSLIEFEVFSRLIRLWPSIDR